MISPRAGVRSRVWLALAAATLASPIAAWAQASQPEGRPAGAAPGTTASELNPAARLPKPPPRRSRDIFEPEPPGPCPLAQSDVQVTLSSVAFHGATAVTPEELKAIYAEYLGRPQPVAVICEIRDRAARYLFDRGVLARVEIPPQRISGGALTLEVIEAHVVNVRVRGDIGPAQAAVERYVEKLRGMTPFDMRKAQRYLLLASDIPGVQMRAAIRPSTSGERGAVDIDVSVVRDGVDVVANAQDLGSKVVGRWGGLLRGEIDSLTPYGEATAITGYRTIEANEQWLVQVSETARFGAEGWLARGSLVYGESHPGGAVKPLHLESRSFVGSLEAAYPLLRTRLTNFSLGGGLDWVDQKTDALGAPLNRDHLRVLYLRGDGDMRTIVFDRPAQLTGGLALRKGISGLGASSVSDPTTRAFARPDAFLVRGAGSIEAAVSARVTAELRVQAQYSGSALMPYEQLALGGLTIGRGYDPAAVLGDSGISGAFDVRYGPIVVHRQVQAAPYAFFDAGWVRNNHASPLGLQHSRSLRSIGAGVVLRIANRANIDLAYAHPLDRTVAGVKRRDDRVLVQLTAAIE
jgi:hemolysin activation/secretion protein